MNVRGKGVLVTGGSRGLGAALGHEFALRGARVALVARGLDSLQSTVARIREQGGEAHAIVGDLADQDAIHHISGQAGALIGDVDVLVQNASALGPTPLPLLIDAPCEALEAVLATNVLGPFRLGKALAGPMILRGSGVIVHVSSDAAIEAYPSWGLYGASKAAFDQLSKIWAKELAGSGVRMFGVDPGEMDTAMHAAAMPDADPATLAKPSVVARRIVELIEDDDTRGARMGAQ